MRTVTSKDGIRIAFDQLGEGPAIILVVGAFNPFRPALEKMAHTLVYESTILKSLPTGLLASVQIPTLVIDGEESPEVMRQAAQSLAETLPDGCYRTLKGQGHDIVPAVVGPVLAAFFTGSIGERP